MQTSNAVLLQMEYFAVISASVFQIVAVQKSVAYYVGITAHNSSFGKTVARCHQIWMFEEFFYECSTI